MNIFTQSPSSAAAPFTLGPSRTRPVSPRPGAQHYDISIGRQLTFDGRDWIAGDGSIATLFDVYVDGVNGSDANDASRRSPPRRRSRPPSR